MTRRECLRFIVLKTNVWWPFSVLNRLPYSLAIRRFLAVCRKHPEILSVYLRHALVGDEWTPALSDIDLTVITSPGLDRAHEFSMLQRFWRQVARVQAAFPMLGEIEVLSENHLETWVRFGIEGPGAVHWQLLAGDETRPQPRIPNTARFLLEAFDYTFWFYLQNVTRVFTQSNNPAYLRTQDLLRLQRKIGRCLAAMRPGETGLAGPLPVPVPDDAGLLLTLLARLEEGLHNTGLTAEVLLEAPNPRQRWLLHQASSGSTHKNGKPGSKSAGGQDVTGWGEEIRSVYLDPRGPVYVILHGLDVSTENRCRVAELKDFFNRQNRPAIFLSEKLFIYLLRFLRPFDHAYFIRHASLLFGAHILEEAGVPYRAALRHDLIKQTPLLLMFPQSQGFINATGGAADSGREFDLKLEQAVALKLLLEHGIIHSRLAEMLDEYTAIYPQQAQEIRELRQDKAAGIEGALGRRRFEFLKQVMDDIHAALCATDAWETLKQP